MERKSGNLVEYDIVANSQLFLEETAKNWKVFIDTCSLLHDSINQFLMNIAPFLEQYQNSIIIPKKVIEELEKHMNYSEDEELSNKADKMLKIISKLINAKIVEVRGEESDTFADNLFLTVFTKFRLSHNLLLITQDNDLAYDIELLNSSKSVSGNHVRVRKINKYGFLSRFYHNVTGSTSNAFTSIGEELKDQEISKGFVQFSEVAKISGDPISIKKIPEEGDFVFAGKKRICLKELISSGGEGLIYITDTDYIAKIYKKDKLTERKHQKILRLIQRDLEYPGVCFPIYELCNEFDEFVGYLMEKAKGKELQKSIFIKPLFKKYFPDWKKRDTVELCITILNKINYLHKHSIIMGDINPSNIMVVSPREVYFVDTDSYQVDDLPCPVGIINYTAPEIQGKAFSDFLRTLGNENFAIATLLFMIMLPGKPPYSQQGGENPIANIVAMDFSYPFGDNSNKKTPDGPWRYIWSHLTYSLKEAFYFTFRQGEQYSEENQRLSADKWLPLFQDYLTLLDSGKFEQQDSMSGELFPTRHKKNPKVEYEICKLCSQEVPAFQIQDGFCKECLNSGEVYTCKTCNKEMLYSNYDKYINKNQKYELCSDCYLEGQKVVLHIRCRSCLQLFELRKYEYDHIQKSKYELPKRCKKCRESKKSTNRRIW